MKYISIEEAFEKILDARLLVTGMAAAEPQLFFKNLARLMPSTSAKKTIFCANPTEDYPCFADLSLSLEFAVMFLTDRIRKHQGTNIHYCPQHLSQWSRNLLSRQTVDVFWGVCTPPDDRGFVSLGPGACYETEIYSSMRATYNSAIYSV